VYFASFAFGKFKSRYLDSYKAFAAISRRKCAPAITNSRKIFVGFPANRLFNGYMQPKSDAQLLREYAESGSESAFTELVTRTLTRLFAALRQVLSSDLACDVAQNVFTSLARGARTWPGN